MSSVAGSSRRAKETAERQAAKERRQKFIAIGGVVLLALVLVYELPKVLNGGSSSTGSPTVTPAASGPGAGLSTATKPKAATAKRLKSALLQPPRDVFVRVGGGSANTLGSIPNPPGLRDPFASPNSPEANVAPAVPKPVTSSPLPGTIIIGKPGAGRVAVKGWIVILASIPTAQGQDAATSFAKQARQRAVGAVSVLNSSNRRPLRGGYWVVYTGPYNTLAQVAVASGKVHASGFTNAYIRELIVYKKK